MKCWVARPRHSDTGGGCLCADAGHPRVHRQPSFRGQLFSLEITMLHTDTSSFAQNNEAFARVQHERLQRNALTSLSLELAAARWERMNPSSCADRKPQVPVLFKGKN